MIKPILFNSEMVKAILDGRKTVTRRAIKPYLPDCGLLEIEENPKVCIDGDLIVVKTISGLWAIFEAYDDWPVDFPMRKAPCQPDDILWVREAWNGDWCDHCIYKADGGSAKAAGYPAEPKWRPSIHMPKSAARIFLRVTDVRAERLQEITEEQAIKEGCTGVSCSHPNWHGVCEDCMNTGYLEPPKAEFVDIWNSTVKDLSRYGWDANPWCWVIEFERCEKPEGWPVCK